MNCAAKSKWQRHSQNKLQQSLNAEEMKKQTVHGRSFTIFSDASAFQTSLYTRSFPDWKVRTSVSQSKWLRRQAVEPSSQA